MMESCRRTGLSGVLCSLSLLCVILDIQLDGKRSFTYQKEVFKTSLIDLHARRRVVCRLLMFQFKSFSFRHEMLPRPVGVTV